jgi:hypothetical protein
MEHFEDLWTRAEKATEKHPTTREELLIKLEQDLKEYQKLDSIPSPDIQSILKTKKLGELLFKLTEISRVDNINTYAALQMEVQIAEKLNQP